MRLNRRNQPPQPFFDRLPIVEERVSARERMIPRWRVVVTFWLSSCVLVATALLAGIIVPIVHPRIILGLELCGAALFGCGLVAYLARWAKVPLHRD